MTLNNTSHADATHYYLFKDTRDEKVYVKFKVY